MPRYGALTLQLKNLSDLSDIGSTYTDIFSASGPQTMNGVSADGSFEFSARSATLYSAITTNVGQVAYVYITDQVASGAAMDVATFIIDKIQTSTSDNGAMVTVSGPGIEDQLTYDTANDDAIDNGSGGQSTTDLDDIMGYAASGWTYTATGTGSSTRSSTGSYHASRGDNVMELLIATAKRSNDIFRLSSYSPPAKTIDWRATADSSGVTLRMPTTPTDYDGSTTTGIIFSLTEEIDVAERLTGIRPYAAGLGGGRVDITDIDSGDTGGDPSGYTTTFASNLIVNSTLETSLGYEKRLDVDLSSWQANDATDATQLTTTAVQLWNAAINYLQERDSSKKFYRITCNVAADLRPGQTVTLDYDEYEGGTSGGTNVVNISGSYTIHDVTNSVGSDGIRMTTLVVGDTVVKRATAARSMARAVDTARKTTRKSDARTTPGAVSASRTINTTQPIEIDGTSAGDLSADRTLSINGLSSVGSANQIPGVNAAGAAWEYKTLTNGTGISITHGAGSVTVTNTSPAGADISGLAYVTIGNTASLSAERALTAGDGLDLTDGGANSSATLAVDVTDIIGNGLTETSNNIILGTPGSTTSSSTNAVTASSHTHAVDATIALAADLHDAVTAGDGIDLTGQQVAVDVTDILGNGLTETTNNITLGTPSSITSTSTNAVGASTHTHAVDATIALTADLHDAVTAGDGINLSGQQVSVDVTDILGNGLTETANNITLGTPSTLTVSTSNSVGASNHSHAITSSSAVSTATASLLATDSSGYLQVVRIGGGVTPSYPVHAYSGINGEALFVEADSITGAAALTIQAPLSTTTGTGKGFQLKVSGETFGRAMFYTDGKYGIGDGTATRDTFLSRSAANTFLVSSDGSTGTGNIALNDGGYIGLGSGAGRIVFDNQATDQIEVRSALTILNSATPDSAISNANLQSIDGSLAVSADSGENAILSLYSYGAPTWRGGIQARSARGTRSSPTASQSDDVFSRYGGGGYTGSAFSSENSAYMQAHASQNWSGSNNGSDLRFYTTPDDSTTAAERWRITNAGELSALDSAVAHGITDFAPTSHYGVQEIDSGTLGGLLVTGIREDSGSAASNIRSLVLQGYIGGASNSVRSTSGQGVIVISGHQKSGTGVSGMSANTNLLAIRDDTSTRMILDSDGDLHLDGTSNASAWDDHDDLDLITGLRAALAPQLRERYGDMMREMRPILEAGNIATFNDDEGSVFINMNNALLLTMDGLRQVYERLDTRLKKIEQRMLN